jgi:hypothetical protein
MEDIRGSENEKVASPDTQEDYNSDHPDDEPWVVIFSRKKVKEKETNL